MKETKYFVDTNILIYAHDISSGKKHDRAKALIEELWEEDSGVISTQVLQEFVAVTTGKLPKKLPVKDAVLIVESLLEWVVVTNEPGDVIDACRLMKKYRYSFWDSLIINAAIKGGASVLFTEDLSHGSKVEGILIKNPFL